MKGLLFLRGLAFATGAVFVVLALAWVAPPAELFLGLAGLSLGATLLALANVPTYVTRNPSGVRAFEPTSFCWSCVFLGLPLVVLFGIALWCRQ